MDQLEFYPGPTPQDETVIDGNASFIEACKAAIAKDAEQFDWCFGNSILTRSKDGCLVWRVDFQTPRPGTPGLVNRVVCWQLAGSDHDGLAKAFLFGQPLDRLK